jgi:hypothetical protein
MNGHPIKKILWYAMILQSKITHCEFPRDLTTSVRDTGADLRQH